MSAEPNPYRDLPSVDKVLAEPAMERLLAEYAHDVVVGAVRERLMVVRQAIRDGESAPSAARLAETVVARGVHAWKRWPTPVINATGVVLHTNLGRAPLSDASIQAAVSSGAYTDLELDLEDGKRSSRHRVIAGLLHDLTGAEDAVVVNNNAGAMLLGLAAMATGKEVVVARGEASEIGGGFRIPDVLRQSGAKLVEVGTVNRTYASDYADAVTSETAGLLLVHRSNFQVVGFTHEPSVQEVAEVARNKGVPLLHDLGSGALFDTTPFGLAHEWTPQQSIEAGAGLVFISGDKLLGGPQAGIVVGELGLIDRLSRHPLARPLRADKLTLAALHATLLHYLRGEAADTVPIWRMIGATADEIGARARVVATVVGEAASLAPGESTVGGGSLPGDTLKTLVLTLDPSNVDGGADELARRLRVGEPSIVVRIEDDRVLLDLRTVLPTQDAALGPAIIAALAG